MKKILLCILIATSLLSCSKDDEQNVISAKSKEKVYVRNLDGTVLKEMPTELFDKVVSKLKKENQNEKVESLVSEYKDYDGTTKLIDPSSVPSKVSSKTATSLKTFNYRAHVEGREEDGYSWMNWVGLGMTAGTTGESRRMEALEFTCSEYLPDFKAEAHVQGIGWMPQVGIGEVAGTTGQRRRLEAIKVTVPSSFAGDVYYRVYAQNIGWMGMVGNGEQAGTVGQSLRLEAFQLYMVIVE